MSRSSLSLFQSICLDYGAVPWLEHRGILMTRYILHKLRFKSQHILHLVSWYHLRLDLIRDQTLGILIFIEGLILHLVDQNVRHVSGVLWTTSILRYEVLKDVLARNGGRSIFLWLVA